MNPILANLIPNLIFGGNSMGYTPGPNLYIGLLDSADVEIPGVARVAYACNRFNWFDTRGGIDALSTGDRRRTMNTASIRFAAPATNYTPNKVGVFTEETGGELLFSTFLEQTYSVLATDNFGPQIYANDLMLAFFDMSSYPNNVPYYGLSAYASSRLIDFLLRGNPGDFEFPTQYEMALMLDDKGTEVSSNGTGYARVPVSLGTNLAVSGTVVSTSATITWPSIIQNWGNVFSIRIYDTSGNFWYEQPLASPVRVEYGDEAPYIPSSTALITF